MSFDDFMDNITEDDFKILREKYKNRHNKLPNYSFSKIKSSDLENIVDIKKIINKNRFNNWFNNDIKITAETEKFLEELISINEDIIDDYNEEDLKVYFIIPILNRINFMMTKQNIRGYYENKLTYKTDKFILNGTTDFVVSKGLVKSEKPYFFIQEFKRSEEYGNPRPQLLAELISGVELNNWSEIKGAYVIGGIWHFVILEKIDINKYEYYLSKSFDGMDINKLRMIFINLLNIKNEILESLNV